VEIAVAGATGSIGSPLADELESRGHNVRRLSRRSATHPVDLTTGSGLADALSGCEVVVDASNAGPNAKQARAVLIEGGRNLLDAAAKAGVVHHVCLSIVGCDKVPMPYYKVKVEQEELVRASGLPVTIVRATQFHTLVAEILGGMSRFGFVPGGSPKLQPADPAEVAAAVADVAEGAPRPAGVSIAGPEVHELGDLARTWKEATGKRRLVMPMLLPPSYGRPLKGGALTEAAPDHRCATGFGEWLARSS
jgi:uncharacterized protein YbjT (DUF2867 family)